jgi:hypothetical protein
MSNSNHTVGKAAVAFTKYDVYRSTLIHAMYHTKFISADLQHTLASYKLLVWNKELLQFKTNGHTLTRFNKQYLIVWNAVNNRGEFCRAPNDSEWFISFREAQPEYDIPPIAYIWRKY